MLPDIQIDTAPLAPDIVHAMKQKHGFAYAYLDEQLTITHASPNFYTVVSEQHEEDFVGLPLTAVLWEFFGAEEELTAVAQGKLPTFKLSHINREHANGQQFYLDFTIVNASAFTDAALFMLVEDGSALGHSQQTLMQERNELHLLKEKLLNTNQQLEETLNIKNLFLQMVSHDLRTPLSVIVGYATFMQNDTGLLPPEQHAQMLNTIVQQTDRLNYLIEDMITLDRIENGSFKLNLQQDVVSHSLYQVIDALRILAERKSIKVNCYLPHEPLIAVYDLQRFWQIAYNLIGNSIKYTPRNGTVNVYAFATESDFMLKVSDSGLGISEDEIVHLFDLYYRTVQAKKGKATGSGIGLYIVKKIVDAHKGTIEVDSILGKGTTFTVTLPLNTYST